MTGRLRIAQSGLTIHSLNYRCPGPGRIVRQRSLEVAQFTIRGLPPQLDGVLATGDLQGRDLDSSSLLGETLAKSMVGLLGGKQIGVVLSGDLYANQEADKMGVSGDVRPVWTAFAECFRWVAGVAGNHDTFGSDAEFAQLREAKNLFFLDGSSVVHRWPARHRRLRNYREAGASLAAFSGEFLDGGGSGPTAKA